MRRRPPPSLFAGACAVVALSPCASSLSAGDPKANARPIATTRRAALASLGPLSLGLGTLLSLPPPSSASTSDDPSGSGIPSPYSFNPKGMAVEPYAKSYEAYSLPSSPDFQSLRREKPKTRAEREIGALRDLQDDRLRQCEDRGQFWEQCFMYGMRDEKSLEGKVGGVDYQMVVPEAALEPSSPPTRQEAGSSSSGRIGKTSVPTW